MVIKESWLPLYNMPFRVVRKVGTEWSEMFVALLRFKRGCMRLEGHRKIAHTLKCECGTPLQKIYGTNFKKSQWLCPKEEEEWDYIFKKLKI